MNDIELKRLYAIKRIETKAYWDKEVKREELAQNKRLDKTIVIRRN